jgi:hypothetical protein
LLDDRVRDVSGVVVETERDLAEPDRLGFGHGDALSSNSSTAFKAASASMK